VVARHGMKQPSRTGPRPVSNPPYPTGIEPDPAKGAKVPRCRACGMPNPSNLVGVWQGRAVSFPLCAKCVWDVAGPDPMDTDPLHVSEAA
jgi:hypothetical protein